MPIDVWWDDAGHVGRSRAHRVVVGACGDATRSRLRARALLMAGREVVFVGGGQTVEQLARTVEAEDAGSVVVDASAEERAACDRTLAALGLDHVRCRGGVTHPTRHTVPISG